MSNTKEAEIQILFKLIEEKTGYTPVDLKGPKRNRRLSDVRRVFCVITRKILGLVFQEIGDKLNRSHSTVMYAINQHEFDIVLYQNYAKDYKELYQKIEVYYIARTLFSEEYIQAKIDLLKVERDIITRQIDRHQAKLDRMNAGKDK